MNARLDRCDHKRIDAFLASDPDDLRDASLVAHLDNCSDCRDYMEQAAAESQSWSDAAAYLLASEFDRSSSIEYSAASMDFGKPDVPTSIQNVLDSLAPSDDPHRLGRLGSYEISGVIGVGGMGVVLKAVDTALDRVVAIKVMAPHLASHATARKRFAREAKAAAAVLHPVAPSDSRGCLRSPHTCEAGPTPSDTRRPSESPRTSNGSARPRLPPA